MVDAFSIWNLSLPEERITRNIFTRFIGDEDGLVAHWNFDEGKGRSSFDMVQNYTATIFGGKGFQRDEFWIETYSRYMPLYEEEVS